VRLAEDHKVIGEEEAAEIATVLCETLLLISADLGRPQSRGVRLVVVVTALGSTVMSVVTSARATPLGGIVRRRRAQTMASGSNTG
jgi:hypothetical protein